MMHVHATVFDSNVTAPFFKATYLAESDVTRKIERRRSVSATKIKEQFAKHFSAFSTCAIFPKSKYKFVSIFKTTTLVLQVGTTSSGRSFFSVLFMFNE